MYIYGRGTDFKRSLQTSLHTDRLKKNVLVGVPGNPFKSDITKATDLLGNTDPRKTRSKKKSGDINYKK